METKGKLFLRALMAGLCIGIGGTVFLACDNKYMGAFLFAIGLFVIVTRGFALYTGMVGYLPNNLNADYLLQLLTVILGNLAGTGCVGIALQATRQQEAFAQKAAEMCAVKLGDSYGSLFILAIGCGILMYLAVDGYKRTEEPLSRLLGIFLAVPVFILCGMEHSIADMFYFSAGMAWSMHAALAVGIIIIGNGVGGVLIPLLTAAAKTKS